MKNRWHGYYVQEIDNAVEKYNYHGIEDCVAASMLADGSKECRYGCLA